MSEKNVEFKAIGTRYLCDILEDMRKAYETRNFSYLPGMIEEMQYRAYRMENRLSDMHDVERFEHQRTELREELKALRKEVTDLRAEKTRLSEGDE